MKLFQQSNVVFNFPTFYFRLYFNFVPNIGKEKLTILFNVLFVLETRNPY